MSYSYQQRSWGDSPLWDQEPGLLMLSTFEIVRVQVVSLGQTQDLQLSQRLQRHSSHSVKVDCHIPSTVAVVRWISDGNSSLWKFTTWAWKVNFWLGQALITAVAAVKAAKIRSVKKPRNIEHWNGNRNGSGNRKRSIGKFDSFITVAPYKRTVWKLF